MDGSTKEISLNPGTIHTTLSSYLTRSKTTTTTAATFLHSVNEEPFVQIGLGLQGAVFEHITHPDEAIKKEHPHNAGLRSNLANEVAIHRYVWNAFQKYHTLVSGVKVPKVINYSDNTDDSPWKTKLNLFPEGYQSAGRVVVMERILPLTKEMRRELVERFVEGDVGEKEGVLRRGENKHCLVRAYLGRGTGQGKAKPKADEHGVSLRNFPLHLEGLREMGVNVVALAEAMGRAFAVMHWGAGVDGDDVEFVLGTEGVEVAGVCGLQKRVVGLWLLDFGQCKRVALGEEQQGDEDEVEVEVEGVYQDFRGAMVMGNNRDFIPSCVDKEHRDVWDGFKRGYIAAGGAVLEDRGLHERHDVGKFIRGYEEYAEDFL